MEVNISVSSLPGDSSEDCAVEVYRPRGPRVEAVEIVQLESSSHRLAGQEEAGRDQQVQGGQPAQQGERAGR